MDLDQAGFVRDRQTQDNIRRVLHVIDHITKENTRAVNISLVNISFDSVRWEYLEDLA